MDPSEFSGYMIFMWMTSLEQSKYKTTRHIKDHIVVRYLTRCCWRKQIFHIWCLRFQPLKPDELKWSQQTKRDQSTSVICGDELRATLKDYCVGPSPERSGRCPPDKRHGRHRAKWSCGYSRQGGLPPGSFLKSLLSCPCPCRRRRQPCFRSPRWGWNADLRPRDPHPPKKRQGTQWDCTALWSYSHAAVAQHWCPLHNGFFFSKKETGGFHAWTEGCLILHHSMTIWTVKCFTKKLIKTKGKRVHFPCRGRGHRVVPRLQLTGQIEGALSGFIPYVLFQWVHKAAGMKRTSFHIWHLEWHLGAGLNLFLPTTVRGLWWSFAFASEKLCCCPSFI